MQHSPVLYQQCYGRCSRPEALRSRHRQRADSKWIPYRVDAGRYEWRNWPSCTGLDLLGRSDMHLMPLPSRPLMTQKIPCHTCFVPRSGTRPACVPGRDPPRVALPIPRFTRASRMYGACARILTGLDSGERRGGGSVEERERRIAEVEEGKTTIGRDDGAFRGGGMSMGEWWSCCGVALGNTALRERMEQGEGEKHPAARSGLAGIPTGPKRRARRPDMSPTPAGREISNSRQSTGTLPAPRSRTPDATGSACPSTGRAGSSPGSPSPTRSGRASPGTRLR